MKIRNKIACTILTTNIITIIIIALLVAFTARNFIIKQIQESLENYVLLFIEGYGEHQSIKDYCDGFRKFTGCRMTFIDSTGRVIYDTDVADDSIPLMDNHINRTEVVQSNSEVFGSSIRYSNTLKIDLLYVSKKFQINGNKYYIRISKPLSEIVILHKRINNIIIYSSIIAFLLSIMIGFFLSSTISNPIKKIVNAASKIKEGEYGLQIDINTKDEVGKLANSLNVLSKTIKKDKDDRDKIEKARTDFFSNVTHELKTPVSIIVGYLETITEAINHGDYETAKSFISKALKNVLRLSDLINDLMQISRIESGEMRMNFEYFDIKNLIEDMISNFQAKADEKGLKVEIDFDPEESYMVYCDRLRISQVMENLLSNAIRYTDRGRVKVKLYKKEDGKVGVSVIDTGIGIPGDDIQRIFERFYRVDKTRSRETGGTGLGLTIVKHILEAHGSKINVKSTVGKGSEFSFTLRGG